MLTPVARPFVLFSLAAATVLLAAFPAAAASAATIPRPEATVRVELELAASNGFEAQLTTSQKGIATLRIARKGAEVIYSTKAELGEERLKVSFGRLGLIEVTFTPTVILDSTEPGEGCTGRPRTLREGIFSGTIDFRGERGYVQLEGPQAEGSMSVISPWECPEAEGSAPFAGSSQIAALRPRAPEGKENTATLYAGRRQCSCLFAAFVNRRKGQSTFYGTRREKRERMEIQRVTLAKGGAGAFVFDHAAGTATLHPPAPLSGRAAFKERPGPDLWRSTIEVPLPGADPLRTGAPGYGAIFMQEDQSDRGRRLGALEGPAVAGEAAHRSDLLPQRRHGDPA